MQKAKSRIIFKEFRGNDFDLRSKGFDLPLTQSAFYADWQEALGKKIWRYSIEQDGVTVGLFQIIKYPLPLGKSYLYIPHGPIFTDDISSEVWPEFKNFCAKVLKKEQSVFLRFDPIWELSSQTFGSLAPKAHNFLYDGSFQPKFETMLDLSRGEEEILAGMSKVNRYTIRQAEKAGFTVTILDEGFLDYLDKFYELICATAERDGFNHSTKEYYKTIFKQCEDAGNGFMETIRLDGEILLINFFVVYGKTAFFLFSGSENKKRSLGYTYLAQWEAIRYSKKNGLKKYNLGAVITDNNKYYFYRKWRGFSDFKRRFGGEVIEYDDFHDVVGSRLWYFVYCFKKFLNLFFIW